MPFPHRVGMLAPSLPDGAVPAELEAPYARLLLALTREALLRHESVALLDSDDERLVDARGALISARHPEAEDAIDWQQRVARRADVVWLDLVADPRRMTLRSRRPIGPIESFAADDGPLSTQLAQVLSGWLRARRQAGPSVIPPLTGAEALDLARRLDAAVRVGEAAVNPAAAAVAPAVRAPFLAALAALQPALQPATIAALIALAPDHPTAARAAYLASLRRPGADRRAILPIAAQTPADGHAYLAIWGDEFRSDRPDEPAGLRAQGLAALLLPTSAYALHNYAVQLAAAGRLEESHRWSDRAAVLRPSFASAHLDCARRLRRVGRLGHAVEEIGYRCDEVEALGASGQLGERDAAQRHHAALLRAFAHHDVGDLRRAVDVAQAALAAVPAPLLHEFEWARPRLDRWRTSASLLARAHATAAAIRRVPSEVIRALALGRVSDADELALLLDALIAIDEPGQAVVAFYQFAAGEQLELVGDGKARLAAARALILTGELDAALEQVQIVQLRRGQSRLDAEIGRVLRLAAIHPPAAWQDVIARLRQRGALRLAAMATRDLADWVPGLRLAATPPAPPDRTATVVEYLRTAMPDLAPWFDAIVDRLRPPAGTSLADADRLAAEWWTVLVPPGKDRKAHAATAVLALALALHHYLRLCAGAPTVLAGAYRHIATEAMHLVRRARFQVEDRAVRALLEVLEQAPALDEWLLDTWTLRLERALDLENEHGEKLVELTAGLPRVASMLRGDERIGWELRFAHDMADLAGLEGPAPVLLERVLRAAEAGAGALPWARLLLGAPPSPAALDAAWLTARAALHPVAWSALAVQAAAVGDAATATAAGQRAMRGASATDREAVVAVLSRAAVALGLPAVALARPVETAPEAAAVRAAEHLRAGAPLEALQVMAISDRASAPRRTGRMALEAGRHADALAMLRYAAHRFTRPDEWALLAAAAWHGRRPRVAVEAYQRYFDLGGPATPEMLAAHISMLTSVGRYAEATPWAHRLVEASRQAPAYRAIALGSMAAVLLGTGRYAEALKHAREARELLAGGDVRAIDELIERCTSRSAPARMADPDDEPERQAALALARGDVVTVRRLAGGVDATRGGVMAAALHAAVMRADADDTAALGAAATTLATTAGATNPGAVLARLLALRLREDAFILIDPSPPPSGPLDTVTFDAAFRARNEARRQRGEG